MNEKGGIMVKTKSVYDPVEASDGDRILVTRYWPRGISKARLRLTEWIKDLASSKELLRDWKGDRIDWNEYETRYYEEMQPNSRLIKLLRERAKKGTITLLCFEREDDPHCHRHLLKRLIENVG